MKNKFLYSTAFIFGFCVPLSTKLGNVALALFLVSILFFCKQKWDVIGYKKIFSTTIFIVALLILGLLSTDCVSETTTLFGRYSTYLLVPLFLLFLKKEQLKSIKNKSLQGLIVGVTLGSIILLTNNFINYYAVKPLFTIDKDLFDYYHTYHCFTKILKIYPTYFGLYVLLAFSTVLELALVTKILKLKIILGFISAVLLVTVLFLNSRIITGIIGLLLIYFGFLFLKKCFVTNKKMFFLILIFIFSGMAVVCNTLNKTYLLSRFSQELIWDLTPNVNTAYNGKFKADSRIVRWETAFSVIKEKPFLGYGSAMEKKILHDAFLKNNLNFAANNNYDSHNQFLSFGIEYGIIGLLLFLFYLFSNMYFSFQSRDVIAVFFCFSLLAISVVENVFKNNAGIIFIAFFSNLFLFSNTKK